MKPWPPTLLLTVLVSLLACDVASEGEGDVASEGEGEGDVGEGEGDVGEGEGDVGEGEGEGEGEGDVGEGEGDVGEGEGDVGEGEGEGEGEVATYSLNFATATVENPLSAGGLWTNNTQGTGGNIAPLNMTSMRVDLAADGVTRIAFATHGGIDYDDSFAFVPGFAGDQFIEAVIYKEAGYNPNANDSNHELELILGCSSGAGTRIWNEFLFNSGGGVDILYLDGGPSDFQSIGNVGGVVSGVLPEDGDVVRATRVGDVLELFLNGQLWLAYDGADPNRVARGDGIGIAGFIRPGATLNKYGFRRVTLGTL